MDTMKTVRNFKAEADLIKAARRGDESAAKVMIDHYMSFTGGSARMLQDECLHKHGRCAQHCIGCGKHSGTKSVPVGWKKTEGGVVCGGCGGWN